MLFKSLLRPAVSSLKFASVSSQLSCSSLRRELKLGSHVLTRRKGHHNVQVPLQRPFSTHRDKGSVPGVKIRWAEMGDVHGVWRLTEEAKWNIDEDMIETHFKITKDWIIAEKDGEVVGCLLLHDETDDLRTAGFMLVKQEFRRLGIGKEIMLKGTTACKDKKVIFRAISYMREGYDKANQAPLVRGESGGKYYGVFNNIPLPTDGSHSSYNVLNYKQINLSDLIAYDTSYHVIPRPEVLKIWLEQKTAESLVVLKDGDIAGYGSIRPAINGFYLGPLYAENSVATKVLFKALLDHIPSNSNVDFFLPNANEAGREIMKANEDSVGLYDTFHILAKQQPLSLPKWKNVFALLSNELGLC